MQISTYLKAISSKFDIFAGYDILYMTMIRTIILLMAVLLAACTPQDKPAGDEPDKGNEETIERSFYAKGADISWTTQMEADGVKFRNAEGQEKECTALMKEIGMNSIRLRVWVDPKDGWCGKEDVLVKAARAQALGMNIMIDFHYSDSWADPDKQVVPSSWSGYDGQKIGDALGKHTTEVLAALKDRKIDVSWIQIGNEVNSGMLHPYGKVEGSSASGFASLFNAGYKAAKAVYPEAKVILHVSNGYDADLFSWFFGLMKRTGVKYDMIGMSLYPSWWDKGSWSSWKGNVDKCIANIRSLVKTSGKPVMICETGMPASEPQMSKEAIQYILDSTYDIKECHGVFYWEPQVYGGWKPADYEALGWNSYDKGAFGPDGKPTIALDPFKN